MIAFAARMVRVIAVLCLALALPFASAGAVEEITWDDLMPPTETPPNPLAHLAPDIAVQMHGLMGIRAQKSAGQISEVSPLYERGVELEHALRKKGVDVEGLATRYKAWEAEIRRLDRTVVKAMDGRAVRLPGYALPLEFSGTAVREFLLVPYVGACIHVPPPPPNQMILVRLDEPHAFDDVFAPVWAEGRMRLEETTQSLYLSDGTADVVSGYIMEDVALEPYEAE